MHRCTNHDASIDRVAKQNLKHFDSLIAELKAAGRNDEADVMQKARD